ncbi:MAG: transcription termination/antitermination protein NusG [Nitrospiraceae bacterium]|jgi:transcriptional antiterminator NusG|nr:MAG: transcription termination/antitermination protein NusG [Nitrospiraceae bacterium]
MAKEWYVVHTYSGFEDKVKMHIRDNARRRGMEDKIDQILIPTEKVVELKSGKKKEKEKKFYPGYILVQMELTDETWHLVSSAPRVTGFVGGDRPAPLAPEEIDAVVTQIEEGPSTQIKTHFDRGDAVRIIDGAFVNFNGVVDDIDEDHDKLKVMVTIFGRQTPVELNYLQVEKS